MLLAETSIWEIGPGLQIVLTLLANGVLIYLAMLGRKTHQAVNSTAAVLAAEKKVDQATIVQLRELVATLEAERVEGREPTP